MKCKPGFHYVRKHFRISTNGKKHIVEAHCRKNPDSKKNTLFASNINYLFDENKKQFPKLKRIKGYSDKGQYDDMIQFWLHYWNTQEVINFSIDPMIIKSIIAVESSFREKVITKISGSSATGLMQVTKSTMKWLSGHPTKKGYIEIKENHVEITQEEALFANVNIAAGTRWLIHKINTSPGKRLKSNQEKVYSGIKYYYGWTDDGQKYLEKVLKIYEKNK